MFIKGKLIVDDESYNILRYENGRYQKVAKNGMAYTNVITNPYIIEIETTSETNLFAWAASKALMKPVKIVLSHPSEMERPRTIQLYDTLCVGYDCYFNAIDTNPMITRLVLSPAIVVENGETIMEQPWKVTDLSEQNNNGQVQQRNNVENNEDAIELLVKKLEGPFTEDGNEKVEELIMGNTYLYRVTEYNDGDDDKLTNTQWSVELNNDGKLKQLKQSDAFEKDGVICFKYTPEKAESIRLYAWCQGASKDVSVEVPVVLFPISIDKFQVPGINRELNDIAEDMSFGIGVTSSAKRIYLTEEVDKFIDEYKESGFDYEGKHKVFSNVKVSDPIISSEIDYPTLQTGSDHFRSFAKQQIDIVNNKISSQNAINPYKPKYSYSEILDCEAPILGFKIWDSGEDVIKYNDREKYSDEDLFNKFRKYAKIFFAQGELEGNIDRMIDKFQSNEGGVYEDPVLSEAIIHSKNTDDYCHELEDYIAQRLKERNGLLIKEKDGLLPLEDKEIYQIENDDSYKLRTKMGKTSTKLRSDKKGYTYFFRPMFDSFSDTLKGTQIATNDFWAVEVFLTNINFEGKNYTATYHVNLWDHFGLDKSDIEAFPNTVDFAKETFATWFALQHLRGYRPFITKVQFDRTFQGNLGDGKFDRAKKREENEADLKASQELEKIKNNPFYISSGKI